MKKHICAGCQVLTTNYSVSSLKSVTKRILSLNFTDNTNGDFFLPRYPMYLLHLKKMKNKAQHIGTCMWEAEAEVQVQGQPNLHTEFQASVSSTGRSCLKHKQPLPPTQKH
jgi:hypothetical protein